MTINTHRYLARIILEAANPLAVGSGERDVHTDQLVITDVNGLPYIPGTALAGVLRNSLELDLGKNIIEKLMGFQGEKKQNGPDDGQGSRLILSHAQMIGHDGNSIDGIVNIDWDNDFYKQFKKLPVRQHVRISHKGAAEDKGKFDEQVVYKGTRFCFEMELVSDGTDTDIWEKILDTFNSPLFRMGGGTRKGFGELTVIDCKSVILDLKKVTDVNKYLDKTSSLNDTFWSSESDSKRMIESDQLIIYNLDLQPVDFFLFSSGLESTDAKMIPVTEKVIDWNEDGKPSFTNEQILIPASSVKGALAHRIAFHYNKIKNIYADNLTVEILKDNEYSFDIESKAKDEYGKLVDVATKGNPAVRTLFGFSAKGDDGQRGNVILSDIFKGDLNSANMKLLNHVAIDRFTGGAMDGALFNEEVVYKDGDDYIMTIRVLKKGLVKDAEKAFDLALYDIKTGMLPLGGGTLRGHGSFTGTITKNGKELENEQ